jgi:DNA-binding response OmpR family regulator
VVDDEQDLTITLKATLEETGPFQVETFTDPVLALSEFKAGVYDLAVLDIRIPKMNGFQLCRKLKDVDKKLKICFLTATDLLYYQETDSDIIDDLGTHCFVSKPVDNEDFVRRLEAILSQLDSKN